jgi:hypothetical protein
MKTTATFLITVEIDVGLLKIDSRTKGRTIERQLAEVIGDCECRMVDSIRWRDAVQQVRSELLKPTDVSVI